MRLSADQLAEHYKVQRRTVTNWLNEKPPCPSRLEGGVRIFESEQVAAWREHRAVAKAAKANEPLDFEKARARKMAADADIAEMEADRLRGELLPREQERQNAADLVGHIRAQILAFPGRYSARIVGLTDLPAAARVLDGIARALLHDLADV